jgi:hypothetical protein
MPRGYYKRNQARTGKQKATQVEPQKAEPEKIEHKIAIRYDLVPANGITAIAVAMTDGLKKYNKNDWVRQLTANRSEFVIDKFNHALQHILNMNVIGINREDLSHALADLAIIAEIFAF